MEMEALKAT